MSDWAVTLEIDKGVPLPKKTRGAVKFHYPFDSMEVGDSFLVPLGVEHFRSSMRYRHPKKFTMRQTPLGIRIWRIA